MSETRQVNIKDDIIQFSRRIITQELKHASSVRSERDKCAAEEQEREEEEEE